MKIDFAEAQDAAKNVVDELDQAAAHQENHLPFEYAILKREWLRLNAALLPLFFADELQGNHPERLARFLKNTIQ